MEYIDGKDDITLLEEGAGEDLVVRRLREIRTFEDALQQGMSGQGNAMSVKSRLYHDITSLRKYVGSTATWKPNLSGVQWTYSFQHGDVRLQHHIENDERSVWIDFEQAGRYPVGYSFVTYTAANNALSRLPYNTFDGILRETLHNKKHGKGRRLLADCSAGISIMRVHTAVPSRCPTNVS